VVLVVLLVVLTQIRAGRRAGGRGNGRADQERGVSAFPGDGYAERIDRRSMAHDCAARPPMPRPPSGRSSGLTDWGFDRVAFEPGGFPGPGLAAASIQRRNAGAAIPPRARPADGLESEHERPRLRNTSCSSKWQRQQTSTATGGSCEARS
jgi:hypothetical protein